MYTISSNEIKHFSGQGAKGPWKKAVFTLTDGKEVTMWGDHPDFDKLAPNASISGDLTKGEYKGKEQWTIKAMGKPYSGGRKTNEIKAAVKLKQDGITKSMDRKEESIKISGAQRDAVLIVTTMFPELANVPDKEEVIRQKITAWKNWLMDEYNDPGVPF